MKSRHKRLFLSMVFSIFISSVWAGEGFAQTDAMNFPAKILYIPCYHSRPLFLKKFLPPPVSPVKKVSVNAPSSGPPIAEVKVITPYELVIDAKRYGSTMLIVWYEDNSVDFFEIRVTRPRPVFKTRMEIIRGVESSPDDSFGSWEW